MLWWYLHMRRNKLGGHYKNEQAEDEDENVELEVDRHALVEKLP